MENMIWAGAAHFSKNLVKTSVRDIIAFEHRFTTEPNIEFETEHKFLYCFNVRIATNEQFWLVSADLTEEAEYTLTFQQISGEKFLNEIRELSAEEFPKHTLSQYYQEIIQEITFGKDRRADCIESVCLNFESGRSLYFFCGEYEQEAGNKFRVFTGEEMVLIFERKEDYEFFGFEHCPVILTRD